MAITFGTGGLRGLMGDGTGRINARTVARASRGVLMWLLKRDAEQARTGGVVIAYDTRHGSQALAQAAADAFSEAGLTVYLFDEPTPTPALSFAVRFLGCAAGVVITASHNPKAYNGYKVYNRQGCQLVPFEAEAVCAYMNEAADEPAPASDRICPVPASVTEAFVEAVVAHVPPQETAAKRALKVVYTPLHGSGWRLVPEALARGGFSDVRVVAQQEAPDGDFPTVKSPNPEDREALVLAIEEAAATGADLALGTDPDCDRVGAAVRHLGEYVLITGSQMGALLLDYLIKARQSLPANGTVVKTIVTSDLGAEIARAAGLSVIETLTGFKYIGEKLGEFMQSGAHTFVFGYEESYGYLAGDYARDKDAVGASLLIAQMAAWHKQKGRTLIDALDGLYNRFGTFADSLDSIEIDSLEKTDAIMRGLRKTGGTLFDPLAEFLDYLPGLCGLPPSDVLKYRLPGGAWAAVRPSGTEPTLKIYCSARGANKKDAEVALAGLRVVMRRAVEGAQRL